jgi:hypothetical protein
MAESVCTQCGQVSEYKQGNKNGKAWAGYFCTNQECKHVDWVTLQQNAPKTTPTSKTPAPVKSGAKDTDMMRLSYRKDLMVACISAGITQSFDDLWAVIEGV